jgi:hypothetical protein
LFARINNCAFFKDKRMHYILIIGAFLWFAFLAPPMVTLATAGSFALIAMIGARTAQAVTGAPASMGAVLRSVGLAFVFAGIALFGLTAVMGPVNFVLLATAVFAAYVMGFSISLEVDFGPALVIAVVTTVASVGLYFLIKPIL